MSDVELLNLLQRGDMCVPSATKIARAMGVPVSTVHSRIKALQKNGLVKGYQAIVDKKKVNAGMTIFSVVKMKYPSAWPERKGLETKGELFAKIPEVQEVHTCSGDWDYLLKIVVKDQDEYYRVSTEKILPVGDIERSESKVVYNTFKDSSKVLVK